MFSVRYGNVLYCVPITFDGFLCQYIHFKMLAKIVLLGEDVGDLASDAERNVG